MIVHQKTKYYSLIILTTIMLALYLYDGNHIRVKKRSLKRTIDSINTKLKFGDEVIADIEKIRIEYDENKQRLIENKITGVQLMKEIGKIKNLASDLDIEISEIEIDPDDTFPRFMKDTLIENPEIRRQTLTFFLSGNFLVVGSFIEELEENKSPFKIHNCSIRLDSLDPLGVIAKLEYLTYAGQDL
tara:strand:+ start:8403 stop:8963 length:561 start_codon:yes stop_codon:yes gene_type:complete